MSNALLTANGRIPYEDGDTLVIEGDDFTNQDALGVKARVQERFPGLRVLLLSNCRLASIGDDAGTPIYDMLSAETQIPA